MKKYIGRILIINIFIIFVMIICSREVYGYSSDNAEVLKKIWLTDVNNNTYGDITTQKVIEDLNKNFGLNLTELVAPLRIDTKVKVVGHTLNLFYMYDYDELYYTVKIGNKKLEDIPYNVLVNAFGYTDEEIKNETEKNIVIRAMPGSDSDDIETIPGEWHGNSKASDSKAYHVCPTNIWVNEEPPTSAFENQHTVEIFLEGEDTGLEGIPSWWNGIKGKVQAILDWMERPLDSLQYLLAGIIRAIGDAFQIVANSVVMSVDNNGAVIHWVTFTKEELSAGGKYNSVANKYTEIRNYSTNPQPSKTGIEIPVQTLNNQNYPGSFSENTRIPVIAVDYYTLAANKVSFTDANFLKPNISEHGTVWLTLRNFIASIIYALMYITAACLLTSLIWNGVKIVRSSFNSPEQRKKAVVGLQKFVIATGMLVRSNCNKCSVCLCKSNVSWKYF